MVVGSNPVAVTSPSDFAPASSKEFLDIQATIECGFTLKRVRDMIKTYRQALNFAFKDKVKALFKQNKNDRYVVNFSKNIASDGCAGALYLCFVYSLDFARTKLANDTKTSKKGGAREYNGLVDVYRKTLKSDGIAGLYRGFVISCVGIFVYRGCYFGFYDSLKPVLLGEDAGVIVSFCLGYGVTVTSGILWLVIGFTIVRII